MLATASSPKFGFFVCVVTNIIILGRNFSPYFGKFFNRGSASLSCSFLTSKSEVPGDRIGHSNNIKFTTQRVRASAA